MSDYVPQQPGPYLQPGGGQRHSSLPTLLSVLVILAIVWLLPRFVENLQYANTRGRERAEVEIAREQLATCLENS